MATNVMMIRDGTLSLGPTGTEISVECQVTNGTITATPDPKEATTFCGKVTVPGLTAFVLHVEFLQDWSATGVSTFLYENDGALVDFTLTPTAAASPTATGKVYISPGDFGGAAGEIAVGTVDLGCDGKPTITSAAMVTAEGGGPADQVAETSESYATSGA